VKERDHGVVPPGVRSHHEPASRGRTPEIEGKRSRHSLLASERLEGIVEDISVLEPEDENPS